MKVYVETNPETIYSGRVKDEVKTTEIRMWFETDEEIEVLSLADYTKQVRKEVCDEIRKWCNRNFNWVGDERSDILAMENYLRDLLKKQSQQIADLEAKLADSEKQVKHWHNLYNGRDKQFQSVRQRYHLLNKLQSNYDKKDKLHLAYMQCAELVDENEKLKQQLEETKQNCNYQVMLMYSKENVLLKQQLHDLPKKIVEEIKKELYDCGKTYLEDEPYIEICIVQGILNTILKKYGGEDE